MPVHRSDPSNPGKDAEPGQDHRPMRGRALPVFTQGTNTAVPSALPLQILQEPFQAHDVLHFGHGEDGGDARGHRRELGGYDADVGCNP